MKPVCEIDFGRDRTILKNLNEDGNSHWMAISGIGWASI